MKTLNVITGKIKCWLGIHDIQYKSWADDLGPYRKRYHSMHSCSRCKFVLEHKSDIC